MSVLCVAIATSLTALPLPSQSAGFALLWTHSVERTEWREEWRADPPVLRLERASIAGSGAGMEPPPDVVLDDGRWTWQGTLTVSHLLIADTSPLAPVLLCIGHDCRPLRHWAVSATSDEPIALYAAPNSESCRIVSLVLEHKE